MATTSTNLHSLVAMVYLTYIPMGLLTGVNIADGMGLAAMALPFIVMLGRVMAALFAIARIVIGRLHVETSGRWRGLPSPCHYTRNAN